MLTCVAAGACMRACAASVINMASPQAVVSKFLLLVLLVLANCQDDPCTKYWELPADKRMQFNYLEDAVHAICDTRMQEGWYRVVDGPAGSDMITKCPHIYSCGTVFPIWLNGQLPGPGQVKQMKACQRDYTTCCAKEIDVTVKNCDTYNVYFLSTSQMTTCDAAFCFGDTAPCPKGLSSETGFMPGCSTDFPNVPVPTEVHLYTQWLGNSGKLFFHCKLPAFQPELFYDVEWYYETVKVHSARAVSGRTPSDADMSDEHWFRNGRKIGFNVHCKIRGRNTATGTPSFWQKSPVKFIGLTLGSTTLRVPEGGEGQIEIKLTAPFPCPPNLPNKKLCAMTVAAEIPVWNGDCNVEPVYTVADNCKLTIYGEDWDKVHHFNIKSKSDDIILQRDVKNYVRLTIPALQNYPTWSDHRTDTITVTIFDTDAKTKAATCTSTNDPHISTFDNAKVEFHRTGEFILYSVEGLPIEIHAVFQPCGSSGAPGASCNCGVAVKAGYDLYAIYTCNDGYTMEGEILCGGYEHLQIGQEGSTTRIKMPNGAVLLVHGRKGFVNLQLDASQADKGRTRGICGTFNDNPQDDEPQIVQNNDYRVNKDDSFFKRPGEQPPWKEEKAGVCKCENTPANRTADLTCDWGRGVKGCLPPGLQDKTCHRRAKRDVMQEDYVTFDFEAVQIVEGEDVANLTWKNGWTEEKAKDYCEKFINRSASVKLCKEALSIDDSPSIDMCIMDIRLSGSVDWAVDAIERLKGTCMREVSRDSKYWAPPANQSEGASEAKATPNPLAGLREQLEEVTCPGECNFRGACVDGVCECDEGYRGDSCDVDMSLPPDVAHIPYGGLCDVSKRPCRMVVALGNGFANTSTLACKTEEIVVTEAGVQAVGPSHVTKAYFESYSEVVCSVQSSRDRRSVATGPTGGRGFLVSVTNDGERFGKALPFVTFDPACLDCVAANRSVRCTLKNDTCTIDGGCYQPGQRRPGHPCLQCHPDLSASAWSTAEDSCLIERVCYTANDSQEGQACVRCQPSFSQDQWQLQPSYCRIDGLCVSEASEHPKDPCYVCDSAFSTTQWKLKDSCQDKKLWVIGIVVAVIVIAVVIGVVVWKVKSNRSKSWKTAEEWEDAVKFSPETK